MTELRDPYTKIVCKWSLYINQFFICQPIKSAIAGKIVDVQNLVKRSISRLHLLIKWWTVRKIVHYWTKLIRMIHQLNVNEFIKCSSYYFDQTFNRSINKLLSTLQITESGFDWNDQLNLSNEWMNESSNQCINQMIHYK